MKFKVSMLYDGRVQGGSGPALTLCPSTVLSDHQSKQVVPPSDYPPQLGLLTIGRGLVSMATACVCAGWGVEEFIKSRW